MAYTPNPYDPTQPVDSVFASTAAAEFRALKLIVSALGLADPFVGAWSTLTGPLAAGKIVSHTGTIWMSLIALADVTLSEPTDVNTDWVDMKGIDEATYIALIIANAVEKTSDTGSAKLPTGTTAQRDVTPGEGWIRGNSDLDIIEAYLNGTWRQLGSQSETKTATGTSVDFTPPAWATQLLIGFSGVSTNGTSNPLIQIGDAGGVEVTVYDATSNRLTATTAHASYTTGFGLNGGAAANILSGHIILQKGSGNTWLASGSVAVSGVGTIVSAGMKTLSDVLTTVRLTTVNGTDAYDAGTFTLTWS